MTTLPDTNFHGCTSRCRGIDTESTSSPGSSLSKGIAFFVSRPVDLRLFNSVATNEKYSAVIVFFYVCDLEDRRGRNLWPVAESGFKSAWRRTNVKEVEVFRCPPTNHGWAAGISHGRGTDKHICICSLKTGVERRGHCHSDRTPGDYFPGKRFFRSLFRNLSQRAQSQGPAQVYARGEHTHGQRTERYVVELQSQPEPGQWRRERQTPSGWIAPRP